MIHNDFFFLTLVFGQISDISVFHDVGILISGRNAHSCQIPLLVFNDVSDFEICVQNSEYVFLTRNILKCFDECDMTPCTCS